MRCVARQAIRRRTHASDPGTRSPRSWPHLLPLIEAWDAHRPESLVGVMKQILCNGDVDKGGVDILMTKICREERQPVLRIDARAVPIEDAVHDHRVAQIM